MLMSVIFLLLAGAACSGESGTQEEDLGADVSADVSADSSTDPDDVQAVEDLADPDLAEVFADSVDVEEIEEIDDIEPDLGPPMHYSDSFSVRPTVEQIYVWNAEPEIVLQLVGPEGDVLQELPADYQGSRVFREITPGSGYSVRLADDPEDYAGPMTVMSIESSYPGEGFYLSKTLQVGYGYMEMRDGTLLSYFLSLPGLPEDGPYPTLVNLSGYSPSRPGKSVGGPAEAFCGLYPILCNAPNFPSGLITGLMGYAVIGVNLRGTGCSGGAYDYFEPLQLLDGYDVIETVAHQPWVKHAKVGMVGLSYPGITQLFVASTKPPSLAAIAPFSVIANTATTLVPGGIYNDGFALNWIEHVLNKAKPYAHGWITKLVEEGDTVCEEHQLLHSQMLDVIAKALENPFYTDEVAGQVDPTSFVDQIEVPVFLVGQTQDEQTGPHFPALFPLFTGSPVTRFTMTNGIHMDGFSPQILAEWANFLGFYVDQEIPVIPKDMAAMVPVFMEDVFGAPLSLPDPRFADYTDYEEARSDYEAEQPLRVIFESGAAPDVAPGAPQGTFEQHFDAWPLPSTEVSRWFFQPEGGLSPSEPPAEGGASSFLLDPEAGQRGTLASGSVNPLQPDWNLAQPAPGMAASFVGPPLEEDMVMIGHASVDLWVQSTAEDADLEACITEVRPDGFESYIMCGWLRASRRALAESSTELRPIQMHYETDVEPLAAGEWNYTRIEMMPFSHIFRAGSQIRVVVDTPGDSMASWRFKLLEFEETPTHTVAHQADFASSIALPLISTVAVPTELPPCNSLRGQPCREFVPYTNIPFAE